MAGIGLFSCVLVLSSITLIGQKSDQLKAWTLEVLITLGSSLNSFNSVYFAICLGALQLIKELQVQGWSFT
jgi:hypothetical protein